MMMNNNRTIVERYYITNRRVTKAHVEKVLGPDISRDTERVAVETRNLELLKRRAFSFVGSEIKKIMRDEGRVRKMIDPTTGSVINRFREIGKEFNMNVCEKTAVDLFFTCFGIFDLSPHWDRKIESEFMEIENLVYSIDQKQSNNITFQNSPSIGSCLLSIIHDKKTEIVKLVMIKARRGHGYFISIRMTNKGPEDKNKRRKKGVFSNEFIVRDERVAKDICNENRCSWKTDLRSLKSASRSTNEKNRNSTETQTERSTSKSSFYVKDTDVVSESYSTESTHSVLYVDDESSCLLMGQDIISPISKPHKWEDDYSVNSILSNTSSCSCSSYREEDIVVENISKKREEHSRKIVSKKKKDKSFEDEKSSLEKIIQKAQSDLDEYTKVR